MAQDGQLSIPLENEYAPAPASEFIYTKATGRILVSFAEGAVFSDVLHRYGLPHELWDDIHTLSDSPKGARKSATRAIATFANLATWKRLRCPSPRAGCASKARWACEACFLTA